MAKFMELTTIERYELIGKLIDAMVYDDEAVEDVQRLVAYFEQEGMIKSTFFPEDIKIDDNKIIDNEP